jgi:iron(II)-dependent oxidoreductase
VREIDTEDDMRSKDLFPALTLAALCFVGIMNLSISGLSKAGPSVQDKATKQPTLDVVATLNTGGSVVVTANSQWSVVKQTFNGVAMVLVPSGCFMMGSENGDSDEKPVTKICFDRPFWIDKYEVANGQFTKLGGKAGRSSHGQGDNRPREQITWFEARDFCEKRGARLPTEAEWEYAARGPDGLVYPWGNKFVADNVVFLVNSGGRSAYVGSKPGGVSWVGALDLSGNVWEWTSSIYRPYPYSATDGRENNSDTISQRGRRGSSWYIYGTTVCAANRYMDDPSFSSSDIGFRCAG